MAILALMLLSALPPAAERFPWRAEIELVAAEVNGVHAYWGGAVIAEQPAAALRRLRAAYGKDAFVVEDRERVLFWHAGGLRRPGKELLAAIRRHGGPLALRVSARTSTPIASQAVWLADTSCALKLVNARHCLPADLNSLAAIAAAAIPNVDLQVVTLERETDGTRLTWIVLPGASAGPLLALLSGGGRELCRRVPFPQPRATRCPLVVRLADGESERTVALLGLEGDEGLNRVRREFVAAGWEEDGLPGGSPPVVPLSMHFRRAGAHVQIERIRRGQETFLVYLGRRRP